MPDVPSLVARCQEGDLRAFAALFDHYQDQLFDLAYTILGEREAAKDAVQDTYLAVFQKIGGFRGDSAFETWLIAILVNRCRQTLRRTLSLENLAARWLPRLAAPANDPALLVAKRQQRVAIAVALASKPRLLADEPTGEVDSTTAAEVLALLRQINQQSGLTTILVTHALAIEVYRLQDGQIISN